MRLMITSALALVVAATPLALAGAQTLSALPPLEAFGQLPAIDQIALSPSASHVAMVVRKDADSTFVDFDLASQTPSVRPLGQIKLRSLTWVDDQHLVIESSQTADVLGTGGSEYYNDVDLDTRSGKSLALYSNRDDYYPFVTRHVGILVKDGKSYIAAAGLTRAHYIENLNRFDPASGAIETIDQGDDFTRGWVHDISGTPVARDEYRTDTHTWSLQMKNGGWKTVASEVDPIDAPSLAGLGQDGTSAVVWFNTGDKANHYYEVGRDGTMTDLKYDPDRRLSPLYNPQTGILAGFSTHDDWITYDYSDPALKDLPDELADAFPGYRTRIESISRNDPKKIIAYTEGPDDAGTYFFIDFNSGKATQLGQAYPDIPQDFITEKQAITYKAADGTEIHGYLTLPPGRDAKNLPLIVLPHGGPQVRDDLGFQWDVAAYASRGYAVFQPNFRGSDGYGNDFVVAGYGQWGRKMETDLSDGVRWLAAQGIADSKRVCIVGYSYGGYAALAGAALDPGVYRCAVSYGGVSDISAFMTSEAQQTADQQSDTILYWKRFLGDASGWDAISPDKEAGKVQIPVLLIHGHDDSVVPYHQSELMAAALKAAGKPVELVTLKGEDHWLSTNETRLEMLKATVDFLMRNNPPQ